jgi:hypothetical protein
MDLVGLVASSRDGELGRFGHLSVEAPCAGADVTEAVPSLKEDQPSSAVVPQGNIHRTRWIRRSSRQLEASTVASAPGQAEEQFLHREVPSINGLVFNIAAELHA